MLYLIERKDSDVRPNVEKYERVADIYASEIYTNIFEDIRYLYMQKERPHIEKKWQSIPNSEQYYRMIKCLKSEFLSRFVTIDKTKLIYYFTAEVFRWEGFLHLVNLF